MYDWRNSSCKLQFPFSAFITRFSIIYVSMDVNFSFLKGNMVIVCKVMLHNSTLQETKLWKEQKEHKARRKKHILKNIHIGNNFHNIRFQKQLCLHKRPCLWVKDGNCWAWYIKIRPSLETTYFSRIRTWNRV